MIRMLGIVALLSGLAYLVTPLTAAGPQGDPTAFTTNLRYSSPALGLGAMLLGVDAGLLKPRVQPWLIGALVVLLLVQAVPVWDLHGHLWTRHFLLGAIGLGIFLILVPVGLVIARQRGASLALAGAAAVVALGLVVGIGWAEEQRLRQGPLPGIDGAPRLPGRHEGCARLVQPRGPARLADRRRRRPSRLQAVRLLWRRPLQLRPVRGASTVRTAPTCRSRARRHRHLQGGPALRRPVPGMGPGPQRGWLRLCRDRPGPADAVRGPGRGHLDRGRRGNQDRGERQCLGLSDQRPPQRGRLHPPFLARTEGRLRASSPLGRAAAPK